MKKLLFFISLCFVACISQSNKKSKKQVAENTTSTETYAIVIAIEDYKYLPTNNGDLRYTNDDATKFYNFLRSKKGGNVPTNHILFLKEQDANYNNIVYKGKQLFSKADSNDKIIFYFSGHGVKGAFVPYDARQTYYGVDNLLYFSDLKEIFKSAQCKTKLLFADACYSGSTKTDLQKQVKKKLKKHKDYRTGIAFMLSSRDSETSIEIPKIKQGLFSYYLINGLKGYADLNKDKKITIAELHKYVSKKVAKTAAKRRHKQHPITFGKFNKNMVISKLY